MSPNRTNTSHRSDTRDPTDLRQHAQEGEADRLAAQARRQQELEDIKWLMSHKAGRKIAWRLLDKAGVFRTSFSPNGSQTFFNEGQRNIGLFVLGEVMEACPERFAEMQKEYGK
jgi:hypothetical protein